MCCQGTTWRTAAGGGDHAEDRCHGDLGRHCLLRSVPARRLAFARWLATAGHQGHGLPGRADLRAPGAGQHRPVIMGDLSADPLDGLRVVWVRRAERVGDARLRDADPVAGRPGRQACQGSRAALPRPGGGDARRRRPDHVHAGADRGDAGEPGLAGRSSIPRSTMIERPASSMLRPGRAVIVPVAPGAAAPTAVAVLITTSQPGPNLTPGTVNVTGSRFALNSSRKLSSRMVSPRGPGSVIASPFRNTVSDLA